ncbi:MAG: D-alanine--D-alanine ligase family protein [Candidatus Komeilibacteria bacterium]
MNKLSLAVIFGGQSSEHEISLLSAGNVINSLNKDKYDITSIAITKDGQWLSGGLEKDAPSFDISRIKDFDLVLPILHGSYGEDGRIQGLLDMMGVPYLFSGMQASNIAMNKSLAKEVAKKNGLSVARDIITTEENVELERIQLPAFVKPVSLGSSVGMSLVKESSELKGAITEALKYDSQVMIEEFIQGRELTVPVLDDKALPVVEIIPKSSEWFDYQAKYGDGGSEEVCPAKIADDLKNRLQEQAIIIFKAIGCKDLARVDFIWHEKSATIYFLEINTIPGLSPASITPKSIIAAGISLGELFDQLIENNVKRQS